MMGGDFSVYIFADPGRARRGELLTRAAAMHGGLAPALLRVARREGGKPYFPAVPELHFSVTHSGGLWLCAFGGAEVGLDLQRHAPRRSLQALSRRFFHPTENAFLSECGYATADFYDIWSAKESYIKYTGEGLTRPLASFSVVPAAPTGCEIRRLPFQSGFSLCICAARLGKVRLAEPKLDNL